MSRSMRELLTAIGLGIFVGAGGAFGLARMTPEALGLFTFCGVIIGAGVAKR